MTDDAHIEPGDLAMLDQLEAFARDEFPDRSARWRRVYVERLLHYAAHRGDMTDAPPLPDDDA